LADPLTKGHIYHFLSKFPFQAYFTTNYDKILERHIRLSGVAPAIFFNRKTDFEMLDIDTLRKCVVKLHGDFSDQNTIIITDDQYDSLESKDEMNYFRETISSYLRTKRFLIVGYSINDPHIQQILKRIAFNIRRKIPIYAIVADADKQLIREWDKKYNVQVITYKNNSGSHKELGDLFEAIERYISVDTDPPPKRGDIDLRRTQSFYMWHKFQSNNESQNIQIDSLKSVVLSTIHRLYKLGEKIDISQVETDINTTLNSTIPRTNLKECIESLEKDNFVKK